MSVSRLDQVIAAIDAANGKDPNLVEGRPGELVYAERMTRALAALYPSASEQLRIAARAQHIERWTSPRASYPEGRIGYLKWRKDLKDFHAVRAGELMAQAGYDNDDISRVQSLIRKQNLKHDAEAQALEDVACIVFLMDYFADFAAKHDQGKIIEIVRKTWAKMSPHGQTAALKLDIPDGTRRLVGAALTGSAFT